MFEGDVAQFVILQVQDQQDKLIVFLYICWMPSRAPGRATKLIEQPQVCLIVKQHANSNHQKLEFGLTIIP